MPHDAPPRETNDPLWVQRLLIGVTLLILGGLILVPLLAVFALALSRGVGAYLGGLVLDPDTRHAVFLTLMVAPVAVALNVVFGIAAAWAIARFRFPGRAALMALIDLPFSVSPVVAGLVFVLVFAGSSPLGVWLRERGYQVIFAPPGLVLVTAFVTLPFVARELIPVMEAYGPEEEMAAHSLGASGWQIFWRVTLPNIKWGLLYGVILSNARAMGEFGAVFVVSGRIAGQTDTLPLRVQKMVEGSDMQGAFAVASVLTFVALGTLLAKAFVGERLREETPVAKGVGP